jgi:D-alanyl-D-alanine carboxypeptidase/D-alanyl-D-alanine-endopeptidase (penicillin-binding protein 4)
MWARRSVAALIVLGAVPLAAGEPSPGALRSRIDRIVGRPAFAPAFWGIEVRSLKSGKVLYSRNAEKNFRPASTLKLVTTTAALDALGPGARVRTTVETAARIDGLGRVVGDVYLVGRGDPSLGGRFSEGRATAALEELAEGLRAAGVRRVEGRLVGHEGEFTGDRRGEDWGWEDLVWWYGAEVSALSFNDGSVHLTAAPGERVGDPVVLDRVPLSSYYQVVSTATTSPAGFKSDLTLVREPGSNRVRLSGTHPLGEKPWEGWVALEDPARYAATVFGEVLEARGVRVTGPIVTSSDPLPAGLRVLAVRESPPLAELLKRINKESHNLHTEMLLRLLGARVKGEGSVAAGHEAVRAFLGRIGVRSEAWSLQDGSGLSRSDVLDPHGLAGLLVAMDRHAHRAAFRESLAVAGADGTLKSRLRGTPAGGRVRAKTGTLRGAHALAGYVDRADGARLAFAIVVNNHTAPGGEAMAAIDDVVVALAEVGLRFR